MDPIAWAIILIVIGAVLIVMELFIPSGGVIGFLAAAAFIGAIVMGYQAGDTTGIIILGVALVTATGTLVLVLKMWPHTPMGKKSLPPDIKVADAITVNLEHLRNAQGISKSTMMPNGEVDIDGKCYDAVSQGRLIAAGSIVRVTSVKGNRIMVEMVETSEQDLHQSETTSSSKDVDYSVFEENLDEPLQTDES